MKRHLAKEGLTWLNFCNIATSSSKVLQKPVSNMCNHTFLIDFFVMWMLHLYILSLVRQRAKDKITDSVVMSSKISMKYQIISIKSCLIVNCKPVCRVLASDKPSNALNYWLTPTSLIGFHHHTCIWCCKPQLFSCLRAGYSVMSSGCPSIRPIHVNRTTQEGNFFKFGMNVYLFSESVWPHGVPFSWMQYLRNTLREFLQIWQKTSIWTEGWTDLILVV